MANSDADLGNSRKTLFTWFFVAIAAVAVIAIGYWWLVASHYVSTDDAYVQVSSAQVTPLTNGRVMQVLVHDSQAVKQGDVLVVIDPADAQLTLNQAEAAYGATVRKVETYFAQAAAQHGEVLAEHVDGAAFHRAPAGDDAVAQELLLVHVEIGGAVGDEGVQLPEGTRIQQGRDSFTRGHLALGMLRVDPVGSAT